MKVSEMRDQSINELEATLREARNELFLLQNELRTNKKLEKPHQIRLNKQKVARLMTIINQKKAAEKETV